MALVDIKKNKEFKRWGYDPKTQAILDYRKKYPLEYLEPVFERLGISSEDQQYEFIEAICFAASHFSNLRNNKHKRYTKNYQLRELSKLQNALSKAIVAIEKIEGEYFLGSYADLTQEGYEKLINQDDSLCKSLPKEMLSDNIEKRTGAVFMDHLILSMQKLLEASKSVNDNKLCNQTARLPNALDYWLSLIADPWIKYSSVPLTVGHYYENVGYNSDALYILKELISPIESKVTKQNLETALRRFSGAEANRE